MREAITLIRSLLAGERVTLDGEVVHFVDGALDMPGRADLPIVVATNGPKMLELAGEIADGVVVQGLASLEMIASVRAHVQAGAERAGRPPDAVRLIARVDTCVADDGAAARRAMRPGLVRHLATHHPQYNSFRLAQLDVPADLREAVATVGYGHGVAGAAAVEQMVPDEFVDRFCLAGTPDEVAAHMARLISAGVADIAVYPVTVPGQTPRDVVQTVARRVYPEACRRAATDLVEAR
jgi:5,10-methylenetetrahydromethanopterin reductase